MTERKHHLPRTFRPQPLTQSSEPVTPQLQVEGHDTRSPEDLDELLRWTPWEIRAANVPDTWYYQGMAIPHNRIAITGTMHSGKSTLAGFIKNLGYERRAFAQPVKQIARDVVDEIRVGVARMAGSPSPWNITIEDMNRDKAFYRVLYQFIGEFGRSRIDEDVWVRIYQERYRDDTDNKVVIDDMRYPNEAEMLRKRGYTLVRIERPEKIRKESVQADFEAKHGRRMKKSEMKAIFSHESEIYVPEIQVDIVITNDGSLKDLEDHAKRLAGSVVTHRYKAYNEPQKKGGWGDVELPR